VGHLSLERRPVFAIVRFRAAGDCQSHRERDQQCRHVQEDKKLADAVEPIALRAHGEAL